VVGETPPGAAADPCCAPPADDKAGELSAGDALHAKAENNNAVIKVIIKNFFMTTPFGFFGEIQRHYITVFK
jgi:hypothetical protein